MHLKQFTLIMVVALLFGLASAPSNARPIVLLFDVVAEAETAPVLARETSAALKTYLRETGKVDVVPFDPQTPLVRRALMEKALKTEDIVNVTMPEQRLKIAQAVGTDYVSAGTVAHQKDQVTVSFWLAEAKGKQVWEEKRTCSVIGPESTVAINTSNAMQSAASIVVVDVAAEALAGVVAERVKSPQETSNPLVRSAPPVDAGKLVEQADSFFRQGEAARAIDQYRKAINLEPQAVSTRIKLARAYVARSLPEYAIDELTRAQQLDPDNVEIAELLVAVYEAKGAPEKAAEVYLQRAQQDPDDLKSALDAADVYWRQDKVEEAEELLRTAALKNLDDPAPQERLALLFAARGMFEQSRVHLEEMQKLAPEEPESALLHRYDTFRNIFDVQTKHVLTELAGAEDDFAAGSLTHEKYYDRVSELMLALEPFTRLMEAVRPPASLSKAHRHRLLCCSLLTQHGATLISYLETKSESKKKEAEMLLDAAKAELQAASALDKQ